MGSLRCNRGKLKGDGGAWCSSGERDHWLAPCTRRSIPDPGHARGRRVLPFLLRRFFSSNFKILEFYGISLHHLNPNSIVHITNFVHACKAFLGIRPHFALFCRIFFLKPQPNKSKPCVVGEAGFQLRGTLSQKYFSMPFKTSNKGWHAN